MERRAQAHSHVYMPRWIETCSACFGEDFKISILNGDFQMGSNDMKLPTKVTSNYAALVCTAVDTIYWTSRWFSVETHRMKRNILII